MFRKALIMASLCGLAGVVFGAFGAHKLKDIVGVDELQIWNKGVLYQFIHVFAIFVVALLAKIKFEKILNLSFYFFSFGILLFSGSLYVLTFHEKLPALKNVGPITPIGGTLFIAGWIGVFIYALKIKKDDN